MPWQASHFYISVWFDHKVSLDKSELVRIGHHHYVKREVQALKHFQHPFIAEYYGFIQSPRKVFILMEFISGGELWSHLYDEGECLSTSFGMLIDFAG
jgi:5'-AMP-activated protein kinase catalytic alpha subunit